MKWITSNNGSLFNLDNMYEIYVDDGMTGSFTITAKPKQQSTEFFGINKLVIFRGTRTECEQGMENLRNYISAVPILPPANSAKT